MVISAAADTDSLDTVPLAAGDKDRLVDNPGLLCLQRKKIRYDVIQR